MLTLPPGELLALLGAAVLALLAAALTAAVQGVRLLWDRRRSQERTAQWDS